MSERIRTFIALELPAEVRLGLRRVQEQLQRARPPVRWVAPDKIHITLNFLGEIPAEQVPAVGEAAARAAAAAAPFAVEAAGLGVFPSARRPRVIWVGIQGELNALKALQGGLTRELAALGFPPEDRPFSPHLTLGRVRQHARPDEVRALGETVSRMEVPSLGRWRAERVTVFRSDLRPDGPIYTPLRVVALGMP